MRNDGWFFLAASEVFTADGATYVRPGIGSLIARASAAADGGGIAPGLAALVVVVLTVDALVWRPLGAWAETFRFDVPRGEIVRPPRPYERLRWIPRIPGMWHRFALHLKPITHAFDGASLRLERAYSRHPNVPRNLRRLDLAMFLVVLAVVVVAGVVGIAGLALRPSPYAGPVPLCTPDPPGA